VKISTPCHSPFRVYTYVAVPHFWMLLNIFLNHVPTLFVGQTINLDPFGFHIVVTAIVVLALADDNTSHSEEDRGAGTHVAR